MSNIPRCRDLADLNKEGKLTRDGFAVAMHLINGKLSEKKIPESLSPSLVPPSIQNPAPQSPTRHPPLSSPAAIQSSPSTQPSPAFSGQLSSPHAWDVTAAEKSQSDLFFDILDPQKRGFLDGRVAVPFMLKFKLSVQLLSQIW